MPYSSDLTPVIHANIIVQNIDRFYHGEISTQDVSDWIDTMDVETLLAQMENGNLPLSNIIVADYDSTEQMAKCLEVINLIMDRAFKVSHTIEYDIVTLMLNHPDQDYKTAHEHLVSFLTSHDTNSNRPNLLNRLIRQRIPINNCLDLMSHLYQWDKIDNSCYRQLLIMHSESTNSPLQELLYANGLFNLKLYMDQLLQLRRKHPHVISTGAIVQQFSQWNHQGLSVMHKAMNCDNPDISNRIIDSLKRILKNHELHFLLTLKTADGVTMIGRSASLSMAKKINTRLGNEINRLEGRIYRNTIYNPSTQYRPTYFAHRPETAHEPTEHIRQSHYMNRQGSLG